MSPADRKDMEMIETRVEDCIIMVLTTPKIMLFNFVSVDLAKIFSRKLPLNALKPSLKFIMPMSKMATPTRMFASPL